MFGGTDSSELDSSWPVVVRLTLLYEFCIPFLRLIIPAALRGLMYLGPPFCLLIDAIVGLNKPPRDTIGSDWSESL
jgi:hypothetical protein